MRGIFNISVDFKTKQAQYLSVIRRAYDRTNILSKNSK